MLLDQSLETGRRGPLRAKLLGAAGAGTLAISVCFAAVPAVGQGVAQGMSGGTTAPRNDAVLATPMTAFKQAVAENLAGDKQIAAYYRAHDFEPIWTGSDAASAARRSALIEAMQMAPRHGLPASKYDVNGLIAQMRAARTGRDLGALDVAMSKQFIDVATDLQTGILTPSKVDAEILRKVPLRPYATYLDGIQGDNPMAFVRSLPPQNGEYNRLLKAKMDLQRGIAAGGYGPVVTAGVLKPGASGADVIALRDRLETMGYLHNSLTSTYDDEIIAAVKAFQQDHGLTADGVAGPSTMGELNVPMEDRLKSVIVALERERWLNRPRGDRHVLVNLTDFSAKIVDFDEVTFETRSVIGANSSGRRSPEFSDVMEHMIINPTWNVPRSIVVKEYLPKLQQNPYAASQLNLIDARGQIVPRDAVDFTQFNARNFPFAMKEPPSTRNALGLVKFMFPNANNIYLHDTPSKSLFSRESRAFSHGCIRLQDPFDFAYALLAVQSDDPVELFQSKLRTGRETQINLKTPIQVHLIYRTAFTDARGDLQFRRDVYGRDGEIWEALAAQGVATAPVQG